MLAKLAHWDVPAGAQAHPNALLLATLGKALAEMVADIGVVIAAIRQAGQAYVRRYDDADATARLPRPSGSKSVRPA